MPIQKPPFPNPATGEVARRLEALEAKIGGVRAADGSVDMKKLEEAVARSGDPVLEKEMFWIQTEFSTREMRRVTGACGSSMEEVSVPPARLDGAQVQTVLGAILEAKKRIATVGDKDGSGRIERGEAEHADGGAGLAGHLAREAIRGVAADYNKQLDGWRAALQGIADRVDPRRGLELNIEGQAERHCETKEGQEAVKWAYRHLAITQGLSSDDVWTKMDRELHDAERSLLRFIPLFGEDLAYGPHDPHLNDREVQKLLGTTDLAGFIRDTKAKVEQKLGMAYADWVAGKDLPGADQLADRDFYRKTPSAC